MNEDRPRNELQRGDADIRLGVSQRTAMDVLAHLEKKAGVGGQIQEAIAQIARETNYSYGTVQRAVKYLASREEIEVDESTQPYTIRLLLFSPRPLRDEKSRMDSEAVALKGALEEVTQASAHLVSGVARLQELVSKRVEKLEGDNATLRQYIENNSAWLALREKIEDENYLPTSKRLILTIDTDEPTEPFANTKAAKGYSRPVRGDGRRANDKE